MRRLREPSLLDGLDRVLYGLLSRPAAPLMAGALNALVVILIVLGFVAAR